MVVDEPTQMVSLAAATVGLGLTKMAVVCAEQPVAVFVNVNLACPAPTAVTTPPLVTVATAILSLTQVPPVVGDKVDVLPIQSPEEPVIETVGFANTQTVADALDAQPVEASVKMKVAVPAVKPVTNPELLILATNGAVEAHVPPVAGVKVVVPEIHIESLPVKLAVGLALTVTEIEFEHPVAVSV